MSKKFSSTVAGASIIITGVGLLSKGFGFLREIVYANYFGLQNHFEIYLLGAALPIILNSSIFYLVQNYFIPIYNTKLIEGRSKAEAFLNNTFWQFIFFTAILSVILFIISPFIVKVFVTSSDAYVVENTTRIFRFFLLTVPFTAGFAILSSYLNAEYNFKSPAVATLFLNGAIVFVVLGFNNFIGIYTIPAGYLFGTILQFFYLLIIMKNRKILFSSFSLSNFSNIKLANNILGSIILIEFINQLYIIADRYFYGSVDSGGLAALNYANVIFSLPISIFSLALSTAMFPKFTQAFAIKNNLAAEKQYLNGLQINLFLFIPITMCLIFFGHSIIKLFYEHGNYTAGDSLLTYNVLRFYSLSLIFYSSYAIINKVIYGSGLIKSLLSISILVFIIKILLNILLVNKFKQDGLALSTAISYAVLTIACYFLTTRKLKYKITQEVLASSIINLINAIASYLLAVLLTQLISGVEINSISTLIFFCAIYIINIIILQQKEFLILKETFNNYFK